MMDIRNISKSVRRLAAVAGLLLLNACLAAETEIRVMIFSGGHGTDFFEERARAFEKDNPGVKVKLQGSPRIWDMLKPMIAAGDPPDLCWPGWGMDSIWRDIIQGQFQSWNPYLDTPAYDSEKPWRETFIPSLLEPGTLKGETYLLPYNFEAYGMWYNRKLFRELGIKPPVTIEDVRKIAPILQENNVSPITFTGRYPMYLGNGMYIPLVISDGGMQVYKDAEALKPGAWKHPSFVRAAETIVEFKKKKIFQSGCIGMNHIEAQMEFLVGRAAMIPCGTWLHAEMSKMLPEDFEMEFMASPLYADGKGDPNFIYAGIDGKGWCIPAKARHPDLGAKFFKFLTSQESARMFTENKGSLMGLIVEGEVKLPEHLQPPAKKVETSKETWMTLHRDLYPSLGDTMDNALVDLYNEVLTPQEFVDTIEKEAERLRNNPETIIRDAQ